MSRRPSSFTVTLARALLPLVVVAAACSTEPADGAGPVEGTVEGELFDFSVVQASPFVFEADPTDPGRGIFRVRTTEPMICAIVWGETTDFGHFNNSLSMNGTGIVDHDVILPGIEPGREYVFRVQGTTADGRQFRSEVGTFVIPALAESGSDDPADDAMTGDAAHGENLALSATVVDVSSEFGPGWEATNALDGDTTTEWASKGDGDAGFITIDLGAEHAIAGVEFWTRSMLDGTAVTETYTVSIDGGEARGPFPAGNPATPRFSALEARGRILRFDVDASTGGNVGAVEVRVLAPTTGGSMADPVTPG